MAIINEEKKVGLSICGTNSETLKQGVTVVRIGKVSIFEPLAGVADVSHVIAEGQKGLDVGLEMHKVRMYVRI